MNSRLPLLVWMLVLLLGPGPALAAGCLPIARQPAPGGIIPAAFPAGSIERAAVPEGAGVQITFLGHSSFLIETPDGVSAVTDYNAYYRPSFAPTIVTMNNAHGTHYTDDIQAGVRHVLRGWNAAGGWASHDVNERDLRVRNIPTAVHGRYGAQELSNSIFVFELPEFCVAHLGHLHHLLTAEQVAELGQIDILLVPIDGLYTMGQELMVQVIEQIRPAVVIPMHYFGPTVLNRFTALMTDRWEVVMSPTPVASFSRADLPYQQVLVLPGG